MGVDEEIVLAAAESLRGTTGREPVAEDIVRLLVHNQVPLLSFVDATSPELVRTVVASEAFDRVVRGQRLVYDEVHGNFERAARAWEVHGIRSICFKSAGIAPSYPYTSENFDILFRAADESGVREVLTDLGYVLLANCDEPQKWLYRLFVAGKSVSAIHVHTRVGWGQGYMIEDEIFRRARPSIDDPVTWVPGPEDVILINAAHAFVENKAFGLHDMLKIRRAIADGVDWEVVEHVARERGWLSSLQFSMAMMARLERRLFPTLVIPGVRFESATRADEKMQAQLDRASSAPPTMPFFIPWKLVKAKFFDKVVRDQCEHWSSKPTLIFLTLARGVKSQIDARPQNSGLFVVSGIDGSGKTSQAEALSEAFDVCHLRRQIVWGRLGATPLMYRLSRMWSPKQTTGSPQPPPTRGSLGTGRRDGVPRMVWAVLSTLDFSSWLLRIRWRLWRGDVVIADRYVSDYDVELAVKLKQAPRFRSILVAFTRLVAAKPVRAFLLDVDPPTARARALPDGEDFDPETGVGMYRELVERDRLTRVDATESFDAVSSLIGREALRAYFNRYGMLGNILFFQNPWQLNRPVRKQEPELAGSTEPVFVSAAPHIV